MQRIRMNGVEFCFACVAGTSFLALIASVGWLILR